MKFSNAVFHGYTDPKDLETIAKNLEAAAHYITSGISYFGSKTAGSTVDWSAIQTALINYSMEATLLAKAAKAAKAAQQGATASTNNVQGNSIAIDPIRTKEEIVVITIPDYTTTHYMKHGTAVCGLGKPVDWPKNHYQAGPGEAVNCKGCVSQSLKELTKAP